MVTKKLIYISKKDIDWTFMIPEAWKNITRSKIDERVREFEQKYGVVYPEFDSKIKSKGASFEEEDDGIDWGDYTDLLLIPESSR
jgi:hypothetical protein